MQIQKVPIFLSGFLGLKRLGEESKIKLRVLKQTRSGRLSSTVLMETVGRFSLAIQEKVEGSPKRLVNWEPESSVSRRGHQGRRL